MNQARHAAQFTRKRLDQNDRIHRAGYLHRPQRKPRASRPVTTYDKLTSYSRSPVILGEVRGGFFQEFILHPHLAELTFDLAQPSAVTHRQWRLLAGVVAPVLVQPVPQGRFTDTEFARALRDRPRRVDDQLHRVLTELRRENPLASSHFPIPSSQWINLAHCPRNRGQVRLN